MNGGGPGEGARTVRLENLPVSQLLQSQRHLDDLLHEFRLIDSGMVSGVLDVEVPRRLAAVIEALNQRYESQRLISRQVLDAAVERGDETVTIDLVLPPDAAEAIEQYRDLLEQAEDYCRRGALLTLEPGPEVVELRQRVFDALLRQLRPGPGPDPAHGHAAR